MNKLSVWAVLLFSVLLNGCATTATSTFNYTQPTKSKIENEVVINKPFEVVWSSLIRKLSKSFYVVNNVAKESRLINVSFSSDTPENYVDCGFTDRTFVMGSLKEDYLYDVAEDSTYKFGRGTNQGGNLTIVDYVNRRTDLDGRINIYVAPVGANKTEVSVNTKYIFTAKVDGTRQWLNLHKQPVTSRAFNVPASVINFTTDTKGSSKEITCFSIGKMETEIIGMLKSI